MSINFNIIHARVSFRNIPFHRLERFEFKDVTAACESFMKISDVSECVIVQNPFRIEVFLVVNLETGDTPDVRRNEGKKLTIKQIQETWASLAELDEYDMDHLDQTLEVYRNTDVYKNLLRLATGLESLVVGRNEILEEIKKSISNAKQSKISGVILNKLFDTSIRVATRIKESTGISADVVSMGDVATKIAEENAGMDGKKHLLIIGTGDLAAMVADSLNKRKLTFDITSRTTERATGFSNLFGGKPIKFEEVLSGFNKFDIIFVATTADYFIIKYDKIRRVMENKKTGTMILDVSDPRAVDDSIFKLPGIKIMFRDQIIERVEESFAATRNKIPEVEKMISKEVPIIEATMKRLDPEPIVKDVKTTVDSFRIKEVKKALQQLGETDEEKIKIIDELTKNVVEHIVSVPDNKPKKTPEQDKS